VFMLANNCLEVCKKKPKYLGHCIADDINDDDNILYTDSVISCMHRQTS